MSPDQKRDSGANCTRGHTLVASTATPPPPSLLLLACLSPYLDFSYDQIWIHVSRKRHHRHLLTS